MAIYVSQQVIRLTLMCLMLLGSVACSSHSSAIVHGNQESESLLEADAVPPVPLINGKATSYSVYIRNLGVNDLSGVTFSASESSGVQSSANGHLGEINGESVSLDASGCANIVAGSGCQINITAKSIGSVILQGTLNGKEVLNIPTSLYPLSVTQSENPQDFLKLINIPPQRIKIVTVGPRALFYAATSFTVTNQSSQPVDVTHMFNELPTGVMMQPISCPDPLPFATVCQMRLSYSGPDNGDIKVDLNPSGSIGDTTLPKQLSSATVIISSQKIATLNLSYPSMQLNQDNPTQNTTTGYITNTGNESANISSITVNSELFSIINNGCIGQLAAGATCYYTLSADMSKFSGIASGNYANYITVLYNDGSTNTQSGAQLIYNYTQSVPSTLGISISGVTSLTNLIESGIVSVINNSNVALTNMSLPVLSGYTTGVQITDPNNCNAQTIYPGGMCNFIIHYTPIGSNINQVVNVGGINARYIDLISGNAESISFSNQYSINVTTGESAVLTSHPSLLAPALDWTNSMHYSESVELTNSGGSTITSLTSSLVNPEYGTLSVSGCTGSLAVGESCVLIVTGTYSGIEATSYSTNGTIMLSYHDTTSSSNTQAINVNANVQMKPIVTPGLSISGILPSTMYGGSGDAQTVLLTLTNNTIATNNGNAGIKIAISSFDDIGENLSGTINTVGVSNACDVVESAITLVNNQSCNVNLVITASGVGTYEATISPSYEYYNYSNVTTSPSLVAASGAELSTLSGSIDVSARDASLNSAFYAESTSTTPILSLSVEQSGLQVLTSTAVLKIINTGSAALTSITMPTIDGFTFIPESSCATLAPGESCNVDVSLSSPSLIPLTDITSDVGSVVDFTYENHLGSQSGNSGLPSLLYQVVAPDQPQINVSESFGGCAAGMTDVTQICNLNPGSSGIGTVGGYRFIVTYTNVSENAVANDFTVVPVDGIATGYNIEPNNNCNGVTLASHNGSCTVEYTLASDAMSGDISSDVSLGSYSYKYGAGNFAASDSLINPNAIGVYITEPGFYIFSSPSMQVGESLAVSGIIFNWYADNIPGSISINSDAPGVVAGTTASCSSEVGSNGATCSGTVTGAALGNANLGASITAPDGTSIDASPQSLSVTPVTYFKAYYPNGCIVNNLGYGVSGDCQCIRDSRTNNIWTVSGPYNYPLGDNWNFWVDTGSSITQYNTEPHCGLTGGWHLPRAFSFITGEYISPIYPGGDWSDIAIDAGANGSFYEIGNWMNNNGFQVAIDPGVWFWTDLSYNDDFAILVRMSSGVTNVGWKPLGYQVILVHDAL